LRWHIGTEVFCTLGSSAWGGLVLGDGFLQD
jgi:hypothetical protein